MQRILLLTAKDIGVDGVHWTTGIIFANDIVASKQIIQILIRLLCRENIATPSFLLKININYTQNYNILLIILSTDVTIKRKKEMRRKVTNR